jgi:Zn-finger nucleic acid-binding protein
MSERQGVEIDYCPSCRGVWLDRGELDKLIERSAEYPSQARRGTSSNDWEYSKHRKKKSLLGEIFDF